jgi:nucleoside-diphosphate-sugar epimerase
MPDVQGGTVCILGAGGPVGVSIYPVLAEHYALRLADVVPVEELIARPKAYGPKWEAPPEPPHHWCLADVSSYRQVEEALEGCDAAINLTVHRTDPALAFNVNVVGAYHTMKAAARHGLERVIHSGPWGRYNGYEGDYRWDFRVPDDAPYHGGTQLYYHSKGLSLDVVNAFADQAGLDVMTFWLSGLVHADHHHHVMPFAVAWEDLGDAFLCGLRAPGLARPNEVFFICAHTPLGSYTPEKAERLLGWRPRHNFGDA